MKKFLLFLLFFVTSFAYASSSDELYEHHIKSAYVSASIWTQASQGAIVHARTMIAEGRSFGDIVETLATIRAGLPNSAPGFGSLRKMTLLTPGHNYFIMRACIAGLLQTMFGDFGSNNSFTPLQPSTSEGYTSRTMPVLDLSRRYWQKIWKLPNFLNANPLEAIRKQEESFTIDEWAVGMFDRDLGLYTEEEFRDGEVQDLQRFRETHNAHNYFIYTKFRILAELNEAPPIHPQAQEYFQTLDTLEQANPGVFIALERKFEGVDAQKIMVLKHSEAKSWKECAFTLVHCSHNHIPVFQQHLDTTFAAIKSETDPQKLQELLCRLEYLFSAQTPYWRGSNAIKTWLTSALYQYKGFQEPKRGFCETDQYAQILPWSEFLSTMSTKDGPLKPLSE